MKGNFKIKSEFIDKGICNTFSAEKVNILPQDLFSLREKIFVKNFMRQRILDVIVGKL